MAAEYMHIGIPVLNKKEGMTYNEDMKFWVSNVDDYDFKIEYLKFEEGTPFPEILSQAQRIIFGPADCGPGVRLAFVIWDDAIVELYEEK